MSFLKNIVKPQVRHWLYRVSMAVIPLLVVWGYVAEEQVLSIVGLVIAVLNISVADGNVTVNEEFDPIEKNNNDSELDTYVPRHAKEVE